MGPSSSLYLAMDSIHAVTKSVIISARFLYQGCSASSKDSRAPDAEALGLDIPEL